MNTLGWTMLAAPCTALAALAWTPQSALQPLAQDASARRPAELAPDEAADWRARLATADFAAREREFEALVDGALQDPEARARLEQWANDQGHREFAWTCRLALREVKSRESSVFGFGRNGDPFEGLRQRMFRGELGLDSLGGSTITIDPFGRGFSGLQDWSVPFQMQGRGWTRDSSGDMQSQGFTLELGPDGVKARVKQQVDGQETEQEYSAKTLDELLEAHPELREHLGGLRFFDAGRLQLGAPNDLFLFRGPQTAPRTDKLGVYIDPEQAAEGGLRIAAVQPGSLAEELGLESGQVLLSLNGRELRSRDDISAVLRERAPDGSLEVEVRGADGSTFTKSWTPPKDGRGAARPLAPKSLGGSRKI